jgi:hypothetical protein
MPEKKEIKWGPKDCAIRLLYKATSQKLISFIFAAAAIFILMIMARTAKALTPEGLIEAIKAIRDIAIALLAVRGIQGFSDKIKPKTSSGGENGNGDK